MLYLQKTELLQTYITLIQLLAQTESEKKGAARIISYLEEGKEIKFEFKGEAIIVKSANSESVYTASASECSCECGQSRKHAVAAIMAGKPAKFNTCWHIMLRRVLALIEQHADSITSEQKKAMMAKVKPVALVID